MGKKGSWFSAIKRVFTHSSSKDRAIVDGSSDKKSSKEKKKGKGILRHSETKSFIPLFREPSSIEKILGEADQLLIRPNASSSSSQQPKVTASLPKAASPKAPNSRPISPEAPPPRPVSPKTAPPPRPVSPRTAPPLRPVSPKTAPTPRPISPKPALPLRPISPKVSSSKTASASAPAPAPAPKVKQSKKKEISYVQRPEPTLESQHVSATKIQAVYRGFMARRSFRALRGLVRLQEVVKGQNAKRQTVNAMKQMQLLVRVQTQIQSRRIQMLENQAQPYRNNTDKDVESTLSKWTLNQMSEAGEDWDASQLTKEEEEARLRKKVEAVIKRERQMAYAYSHRLWKASPKSNQAPHDIRSNGYPWWWNWLERQLHDPRSPTRNIPSSTPPKPVSEYKASPRRLNTISYKFDNRDSLTPRSSRSAIPFRARQFQPSPRSVSKDVMLKDDDSLVSCPPFSVPNYMTPTVSAKAKSRANSNPKERLFPGGTPDSKRRFSFPLTPNSGSFNWTSKMNGNRNLVSSSSSHQMVMEKNETPRSVDSTVSMPVLGVRKPFNRFV